MCTNTITVVVDGFGDDHDDGPTPERYHSRFDRPGSQLPVRDDNVLEPNTTIQHIRRAHGTRAERSVHHGELLNTRTLRHSSGRPISL